MGVFVVETVSRTEDVWEESGATPTATGFELDEWIARARPSGTKYTALEDVDFDASTKAVRWTNGGGILDIGIDLQVCYRRLPYAVVSSSIFWKPTKGILSYLYACLQTPWWRPCDTPRNEMLAITKDDCYPRPRA